MSLSRMEINTFRTVEKRLKYTYFLQTYLKNDRKNYGTNTHTVTLVTEYRYIFRWSTDTITESLLTHRRTNTDVGTD